MLSNARKRAAGGLGASTQAAMDIHVRCAGGHLSLSLERLPPPALPLNSAEHHILPAQPTLVYQDIRSFLLGSAEAVQSESGRLSRDDYLVRLAGAVISLNPGGLSSSPHDALAARSSLSPNSAAEPHGAQAREQLRRAPAKRGAPTLRRGWVAPPPSAAPVLTRPRVPFDSGVRPVRGVRPPQAADEALRHVRPGAALARAPARPRAPQPPSGFKAMLIASRYTVWGPPQVFSIYRQLTAEGFRGVPIHCIMRDEVQARSASLAPVLRLSGPPGIRVPRYLSRYQVPSADPLLSSLLSRIAGLHAGGDARRPPRPQGPRGGLLLRGHGADDRARRGVQVGLLCLSSPHLHAAGQFCQLSDFPTLRFEDIRTLFYAEGERRRAEALPLPPVHTPPVHALALNYRTHAGVLDCAHVCVALLRQMFPLSLDTLPRERAFFDGPAPLLLNRFNEEDLSILVSGTDRATSQVEFGAHQVVLVRSKESIDSLPTALRLSSALIMTVAQAKGLEFDDVFIVDFFADSTAGAEWRACLSFVDKLQEARARERGPSAAAQHCLPTVVRSADSLLCAQMSCSAGRPVRPPRAGAGGGLRFRGRGRSGGRRGALGRLGGGARALGLRRRPAARHPPSGLRPCGARDAAGRAEAPLRGNHPSGAPLGAIMPSALLFCSEKAAR